MSSDVEFAGLVIKSNQCQKRQMTNKERPTCDCPTFHVFWGVQSSMYDSLCFFIPGPESLNGLPQLHQLRVLQAHDGIRSLIFVRRETAHFYINKNKHDHNIRQTVDNSRAILCCWLSVKSQSCSPLNSSAWPISLRLKGMCFRLSCTAQWAGTNNKDFFFLEGSRRAFQREQQGMKSWERLAFRQAQCTPPRALIDSLTPKQIQKLKNAGMWCLMWARVRVFCMYHLA